MARLRGTLYAINWAVAALFVVAAALQVNDPDPFGWIALYVAAAGACIVAGRFDRAWLIAAVIGAAGALWAVLLLPQVIGQIAVTDLFDKMHMKGGRVEIGREVGGLAIVTGWMIALVVAQLRARGTR